MVAADVDLTTAEQALAEQIRQARATKRPISGKTADHGVDLAGAYRVQTSGADQRVLKGYKLGLISAAKQQQMQIDRPIYGRIYADMLRQTVISLGDFIQARMEPEIAIVTRHPIAPDASAGALAQSIGGYFLGVDVLDSVWRDYKFSAAEVVADNSSGGAFLLSGRMSDSLVGGTLRLYLNGDLLTEGHTDALGNPMQRLHWLTQQVGTLEAGSIVFLGSPAASIPAKPGTLEVVGADGQRLIAKITA